MVDDMIKEWYCMLHDRVEGPFSLQELRRMTESGALARGEMVRKGEAGTWVAVRSVLEPLDDARTMPPVQAVLPDPVRDREAKVALDAPISEWGIASLIVGCVMLLATPISVNTMLHVQDHGGSRFVSFLLVFMMELLLLVGNGIAIGLGVMGLISYIKKQHRLPLNVAGASVSVLSLFFWMLTAIIVIRSME